MRPYDHSAPARRDEADNLLSTPDEHLHDLELSPELDFLSDAVHRFSAGGAYLYGGAPGGGKSTLSLQTGLDLSRRGIPSLFILTEQSAAPVKARAQQMVSELPQDEAERAMSMIAVEQNVRDVTTLPTFAMHEVLHPSGRYHGVKLIVLDSIQGEGLPSAATKAYSKVLEFARMCTRQGITVILVSHVTKRRTRWRRSHLLLHPRRRDQPDLARIPLIFAEIIPVKKNLQKKKENCHPSSKWKYRVAARPLSEAEEERLIQRIDHLLAGWIRRRIEQEEVSENRQH